MQLPLFFLFLLLLTGCAITQQDIIEYRAQCAQKPNTIFAAPECLEVYRSVGTEKEKVIVILPDVQPKEINPLLWMAKYADFLARKSNVTTYILAYPAYASSTDRVYEHDIMQERYFMQKEYNLLIANALRAIKNKEVAKEVYVMGAGVGASIAANIAGLKPALINRLALYGGAYDFNAWFSHLEYEPFKGAFDPDSLALRIESSKFLLLAGAKDKIGLPRYSYFYANTLKEHGLDVEVRVFKMEDHSVDSSGIWKAVTPFFKGKKKRSSLYEIKR